MYLIWPVPAPPAPLLPGLKDGGGGSSWPHRTADVKERPLKSFFHNYPVQSGIDQTAGLHWLCTAFVGQRTFRGGIPSPQSAQFTPCQKLSWGGTLGKTHCWEPPPSWLAKFLIGGQFKSGPTDGLLLAPERPEHTSILWRAQCSSSSLCQKGQPRVKGLLANPPAESQCLPVGGALINFHTAWTGSFQEG